jgi:hypothetical protein
MSFASELRQVQHPSGATASASWRAQRHQVLEASTSHPFAKAFASGGLVYVAATAVLLLVALRGLPADATSYELGYATARALAQFTVAGFVPALIMGMAVHQSQRPWRFWQIALAVTAMFCVMAALQALGAAPH